LLQWAGKPAITDADITAIELLPTKNKKTRQISPMNSFGIYADRQAREHAKGRGRRHQLFGCRCKRFFNPNDSCP